MLPWLAILHALATHLKETSTGTEAVSSSCSPVLPRNYSHHTQLTKEQSLLPSSRSPQSVVVRPAAASPLEVSEMPIPKPHPTYWFRNSGADPTNWVLEALPVVLMHAQVYKAVSQKMVPGLSDKTVPLCLLLLSISPLVPTSYTARRLSPVNN